MAPNILLLNRFFEKISISGENCEKPFVKGYNRFEGKGASGDKNQYNFFCRKRGKNLKVPILGKLRGKFKQALGKIYEYRFGKKFQKILEKLLEN